VHSDPSGISGDGALAVVFGGFGFTSRQLAKHEAIYSQHGFECHSVLSSIRELITPDLAAQRGQLLAKEMMARDKDVVIHTVSGSFWTAIYTLSFLPAEWRDCHVRAIMFDSCPPMSNVQTFGGWLAWFLQVSVITHSFFVFFSSPRSTNVYFFVFHCTLTATRLRE
jgi:hypothetical protein